MIKMYLSLLKIHPNTHWTLGLSKHLPWIDFKLSSTTFKGLPVTFDALMTLGVSAAQIHPVCGEEGVVPGCTLSFSAGTYFYKTKCVEEGIMGANMVFII